MIDEKRLIEEIAKRNVVFTEGQIDLLEYLIESQPKLDNNLSEFGKWIPVSERLPSQDCYCLITTSDDEMGIGEYKHSNRFGWNGFGRVIAWMPLPQAYKGE